MEKISHPDIIVTSPDGEYLIIVEIKPNDVRKQRQYGIDCSDCLENEAQEMMKWDFIFRKFI